MIMRVKYKGGGYGIEIRRGALDDAGKLFGEGRKVLVVTDDGVPSKYAETVASGSENAFIYTVPRGEGSKSPETLEKILCFMLEKGFTRDSAVAAVGGGVVGDLAGFAASIYMRGIDFYNIPTTLLSQVDSSVGGKTAVNLCGIKNVVGTFYRPERVLIDPDCLKTLPERHFAAGMAEALKMSLTCDRKLFESIEKEDINENIEKIIEGALKIKRYVVEKDEREGSLRKVLNFGHTIGHGIESVQGPGGLLHGECVALGMIPMCSEKVRARLIPVLEKLGLPTRVSFDKEKVFEAMKHDKKSAGKSVTVVKVAEIGDFTLEEATFDDIFPLLDEIQHIERRS